jgi:hypothetical protein
MTKIDLKQQLNHLYQPSAKEVVLLTVPTMKYLMVDGAGDPNTAQAHRRNMDEKASDGDF